MDHIEEKSIKLARGIGRRAERGHLWVFSNETAKVVGNPQPGEEVAIYGGKGQFLGMGLMSASSLIRARIYSRKMGQRCDGAYFEQRLREALAYRKDVMGDAHSFRLIHSETDGLPGLIVDVFGDHVVIQISTHAMDTRRDAIVEALKIVLSPVCIIERSDVPTRKQEGLEERKGVLFGTPTVPCEVRENGVTMFADLLDGQKTGYFLDQIRNRSLAIPFFKDKRVLDLFCYVGSWSVVAAAHGAKETLGVDSSQPALELAVQSVEKNNLSEEACQFINGDVFALARDYASAKREFDVIILDPPALAKSKKDCEKALRAYRELNIRAMQMLAPDGLLITCSCSHHIMRGDFHEMLVMAAKDAHVDCSLLWQTSQSPDHPIHLPTPETSYLKVFFLRKRSL